MKKCPTCEKTFEDSMRFCQVDGTPLVDDAPAFDPYATIVAQPAPPVKESVSSPPAEEPAMEAPADAPEDAADEPAANQTIGSLPIGEPEDVLDLPQNDPLKTMYVSEDEMKNALDGAATANEPEIMEIPPIEETPAPEPPNFIVPDVPAPSFGGAPPPPSPFSYDEEVDDEAATVVGAPEPQPFEEAATMIQPDFQPEPAAPQPEWAPPPAPGSEWTPQAAAPVAEWTPPPAPDASWQNQEIGSNTPFQPPPPGTGSVNQTLPIISLILGIVSLCCYISPLTGIAALITGYIGLKNIKNDPANYGGRGLAIAGMITGGVFAVLAVIYWIVIIVFYGGMVGLSILGNR